MKQNESLSVLRHSCEHVLHQAIVELFPGLKRAMGPATPEGFYLDFDYDGKVTEDDFPKIGKRMQEIIKADLPLIRQEISIKEAREMFNDNSYKLEWVDQIEESGEKATVYWTGEPGKSGSDVDLCKGPHVASTGKVGPFKLLSIAGAYWHGDEKNKMLTRIYGTCFPTQKELDDYLNMLEEAKKRDHRKLGQELDIFTISDEVGAGLILWLPKGTIVREQIENWAKETEERWGYQRVTTPHITKEDLYKTSGHLPYYDDDLYSPIDIEGEKYYLKPMNCPHHHMIYKSRIRSYRELPLRLAEYGHVYRFERSGTLHGLMRTRGFCQNDAHIYAQPEKAVEEFVSVFNMHKYYYDILGIKEWWAVLGLRDQKNLRKKYHGDDKMWDLAEKLTKEAVEKAGIKYVIEEGGAAHYGPKLDIYIKSSIGKEYAIGTTQLDLYMPERFNLKYTNENGKETMPYVIHRAPLGSHERMVGFLLEHFGGAFPIWLAPVQIQIIPITERNNKYAQNILEQLLDSDIRAELDNRSETMQSKIRDAQMNKIPYMIIVGEREEKDNKVAVRSRDGKNLGVMTIKDFIDKISEEIEKKS